jgi:hypothetical protein
MIRKTALLTCLAALLAAGTAHAAWRVVGPGIAVHEARSGTAALSVECLGQGMVVGLYNLTLPFDHEERLDLVVDGTAHPMRMYGSGDRIVLADADAADGGLDLSADVVAALKAGALARLEGDPVSGLAADAVSFRLTGSARAIDNVARHCR